jgi:hypothetical protein
MPASTSTSKRKLAQVAAILVCSFWAISLAAACAHAADAPNGGSPNDKTTKPEEEDFSQTPYTEYGSFNEEKDEEEDAKFFQYGRFFGVSLGLGIETVDGDRGTLYQGGFPTFDAKIHYWFDFNFALDIDFYLAQHYFVGQTNASNPLTGRYNVNITHLGVDFKYYFDTKNLAAAISFANPYLLVGGGTYTKSLSAAQGQSSGADTDTQVGFNAGAGLEFALKPRKVYFTTEARIHVVTFNDANTQDFAGQGINDLHGNFYTFVGSLLFTW